MHRFLTPSADTDVWKLIHEIYEGDAEEPTVTHVFHGATKARAREVKAAHMETDKFLAAAEKSGKFEGIALSTEERWEKE